MTSYEPAQLLCFSFIAPLYLYAYSSFKITRYSSYRVSAFDENKS